jgi:hypothetical protein
MRIPLETRGSCSRLTAMVDISILVQTNNVLSNKHMPMGVSHL